MKFRCERDALVEQREVSVGGPLPPGWRRGTGIPRVEVPRRVVGDIELGGHKEASAAKVAADHVRQLLLELGVHRGGSCPAFHMTS